MRPKKRYIRFEKYPSFSNEEMEFMFQDQSGFIFETNPKTAEKLRPSASQISGSLKKMKIGPKGLNRSRNKRSVG
ncbi:MAG: hypothetical protein ACYC7D_01970 [Nitrososphaerales archaeon]